MTDYQFEDCEKLGFDRDRLAAVPAYFSSYLAREKFAGISISVAREGKIALLSHQGKSAFDGGFDLDDSAIFRIYSMTKPITSVAIMQLYEKSIIKLTDPITKFIPAFQDVKVFDKGTPKEFTTREPERMINIHDLLTIRPV
jgi:CubicO group peptidase (beta-lactamase class C family)